MAINSSVSIRGSVGAGGMNGHGDVTAIQNQLNAQMNSPRVKLVVDGRCGPKTRGMIVDFQSGVLGVPRPDGRVDPNGRTLAALNDPASEGKWARMSMPPPGAGAGAGGSMGGLSPLEQQRLDSFNRVIATQAQAAPAKDFLAYVSENEVATLKMLLSAQGAVQYPVELVMALAKMRQVGFTAKEIATLIADASKLGPGRFDNALASMRLVGTSGKLAATLKTIGNIANILQILTTATVVVDHFRAGRFGPGFAEIYGTGMGIAIPWAGFLNAMQDLLYAANPGAASDSRFQAAFRFMIACDPIGAGKTAVDTTATFVTMAINALFGNGVKGNDLDELVKRMRNSPMRFWTDIGDSMGDWMGDRFGDWYYRNFLK